VLRKILRESVKIRGKSPTVNTIRRESTKNLHKKVRCKNCKNVQKENNVQNITLHKFQALNFKALDEKMKENCVRQKEQKTKSTRGQADKKAFHNGIHLLCYKN